MSTISTSASISPAGSPRLLGHGPAPIADRAPRRGALRHTLFLVVVTASIVAFWIPLKTLCLFALRGDTPYDQYSYTLVIPLISATIVLMEKRRIFANVRWAPQPGVILFLAGLALNEAAKLARDQIGGPNSFSARMLALVLCWIAGFIFCYGISAFRQAAFTLLFLSLTVPIPDWGLEKPIAVVRYGSTVVCSMILHLAGVHFVRHGFEFFLNNVTILVARECSGIHSILAILIISLIAGHLYFSSAGKRVALVLCALPIVCLTNGLRIASLTLLAEYVNPRVLQGPLHHQGGMGFFLLALLLLFEVLYFLRDRKVLSPGMGSPRSELR